MEIRDLAEVAAWRAVQTPDRLAYTFLADGSVPAGEITFAQLDAAARQIAARLREIAVPGDRALLVYEAGLDFVRAIFGCFYAGVIAVPIPAPEASRLQASLPRLKSVAADSGARVLMGNAHTLDLLKDDRHRVPSIPAERWIDSRTWLDGGGVPPLSNVEAGQIAYLQYTSGSTSTPKGVVVSHANLIAHLKGIQEALQYDADSVSVCWMPHFHDYGLVEGVLLPVLNGTPAYILSPFAFLKRPVCWLEAISKFRGTHTQGPNFAYRHCVRRIDPAAISHLGLSSWRSAGNGAEPIHPDTSDEFYALLAPAGLRREALRPVFGLAEATLLVTTTPMEAAPVVESFDADALASGDVIPGRRGRDVRRVAGCGLPLPDTEIAIVDPETKLRTAPGRVGEVWVTGPGVCDGYWQRTAETEETFHARIAGESGGLCMRTGDLGFLHNDELFITSRCKDLIIIRGSNYYPEDVEWTVQRAHPALRADNGAVFGIAEGGEERLCVVQEVERAQYSADELDGICTAISEAVAGQYGVSLFAAALIRRASIPKTSSGKIKRSACRQAFQEGTLKVVHVWKSPQAQQTELENDPSRESRRVADSRIAWLRQYAERRINSRLIDERRCVPPSIVLDFGNQGLFGLQTPKEYGGLDLRYSDTVRIYQQLAAADLTLATMVLLHNTNGIRPILGYAAPALREQALPMLAAGRELSAFALSEPGAGSNLGGIEMKAVPDGDGAWKLYGEKRWNASAWAGWISVFVRITDAEGRLRGVTGFAVRSSDPGLEIGPESLTFGVRGIMQNSVRFDGVRVTRGRMLGEPGRGMQAVEDVLAHGRFFMAAVSVGAMRRCAQLILRYASRRRIDTGLLLDNAQTLAKVTELVHRISLDSALVDACAERLDRGGEIVPEGSMALKVSATDSLNFAADLLMQILGGRGYMENNLAPQILRDARLLSIGEGPNESLLAAIGRSVRLTDAVTASLGIGAAFSASLKSFASASAAMDETARQWLDSQLGRLAIVAMQITTATAQDSPALAWAKRRWDALSAETAGGVPALLAPTGLRLAIEDYQNMIGDLEPMAPDVDFAMDPLLRRECKEEVRETPGAVSKREILRALLAATQDK